MENYRGLAGVYDYLVAGVDFEGWADYIEEILKRFKLCPGSVLDLACGTGNTLLPMAIRGYEAKGMDLSSEMIERARSKAKSFSVSAQFFVGDMRDFLLESPVDLVTCFHDGMNYITEPCDLKRIFENTGRNLSSNGVFIFDLNTLNWIEKSDRHPVVINEEEITIIYTTDYEPQSLLWIVDLTCFVKEGEKYQKFSETHCEKGYETQEVLEMLTASGFTILSVYDAFTFEPPRKESRRHFYSAQKKDE